MMKHFKTLMLLVVAILAGMPAFAQMPEVPQFPMDPAIRYGKLPNGMTYYIRHNEEPKERANFYIAQKVGSVQEEDSQRGLAHFLEHMCFNGTKNFPGNGVVEFCESIGVKFGANLNAYTSTDETVYNINDVPTTTQSNIDKCLLILHDWSNDLLLEPEEIDKERGVIHEEWRMRSSASMRIMERNLPTIYPGSKYGNRMPIGLMEVIDNFTPEFLRAYYEKWYRPDLQGLVVVGDIDVDYVEAKIKEMFSSIEMPENPAQYELYPVPDNEEAIYVIDKDKEQQQGIIQLMFKTPETTLPMEYRGTPIKMQMDMLEGFGSSVLDERLDDLSKKADCPFVGAGSGYGKYLFSKTCDAFSVYIVPKPGQEKAAVQMVMEEVERARQFGFTESEIGRARDNAVSRMERLYENRNKHDNEFYVQQYVRHFLEGDYIPDLETEFQTYKMMAQQLPTEAYNQVFKQLTASTDKNFVVFCMFPEKDDYVLPTVDDFKAAIAAAKSAKLEGFVDNVKNEPLIKKLPKKQKIQSESAAEFGYTCWTLKNGARVFYKVTDFSDTEIAMTAISKGGLSKIAQNDLLDASMTDAVISMTGKGNFKSNELQKKLAGKQAGVSPSIDDNTESLSGHSTPKDLRTLFELTYLHFQKPMDDPEAYNNLISMMRTALENAEKNPQVAFQDSIQQTIWNHHPRKVEVKKVADLDKLSYENMKNLYSTRFQSAGDFDFIFTGAINVDSLRLFTEQYIATLPGVKQREEFTDLNIRYANGDIQNRFVRSMETPQANIVQFWHGDIAWNAKNRVVLDALGEILSQRYLKSIREEGGMSYSVGANGAVRGGFHPEYLLQIYCPVQPAKMDSALYLMEVGIREIAEGGVTAEELGKWREFAIKDYNDGLRKNGYWHGLIQNQILWGRNSQAGYLEALEGVTSEDIQAFVKNVFLRDKNRAIITMLPADFTE